MGQEQSEKRAGDGVKVEELLRNSILHSNNGLVQHHDPSTRRIGGIPRHMVRRGRAQRADNNHHLYTHNQDPAFSDQSFHRCKADAHEFPPSCIRANMEDVSSGIHRENTCPDRYPLCTHTTYDCTHKISGLWDMVSSLQTSSCPIRKKNNFLPMEAASLLH